MKHRPLAMLVVLFTGAFCLMAFAPESQYLHNDRRGRCNRHGVDCVFEKVLEIVAERYGVTELPDLAPPTANYVNATQVGDLVFVSSAGPENLVEGGFLRGELPNLTLEEAQESAVLSCIRGLRFLKSVIGDLDKVKKVVMVTGNVNVAPDYDDLVSGPVVGAIGQTVDGCSDFLVEVFGEERGKHARASGGKIALPFNLSTEIELIVEVK